MKFCPKCKSLMLPKKSGSKTVMACTQCHATDDKAEVTILSEVTQAPHKIEVIEPSDKGHLPLTDIKCEKCSHKKAYYWLIQTRAADEAATKFYKCEKCEHIWREY